VKESPFSLLSVIKSGAEKENEGAGERESKGPVDKVVEVPASEKEVPEASLIPQTDPKAGEKE